MHSDSSLIHVSNDCHMADWWNAQWFESDSGFKRLIWLIGAKHRYSSLIQVSKDWYGCLVECTVIRVSFRFQTIDICLIQLQLISLMTTWTHAITCFEASWFFFFSVCSIPVSDPCAEVENLSCDHGCTLDSTDRAVCFCNTGYRLQTDKQTCTGRWPWCAFL